MSEFFKWIFTGLLGNESGAGASGAPNGYHALGDSDIALELGVQDEEAAARAQFIEQAEEFYAYARTPFQQKDWDTNVGFIRIYDDDSNSYWYWMLEHHPVARLIRCNNSGNIYARRIKKAGLVAFREQEVKGAFDFLEELSRPPAAVETQPEQDEIGMVPNSNTNNNSNGSSIMTPLIVQGDKKDD